MTIVRSIPPQDYDFNPSQSLAYGNYIVLANIFNSYVLLSGGSSVRSNTTMIGPDEKWEILSTQGAGGFIKYGDLVKLALPDHGGLLLSGGSSVRTNTTTVGTDERWQIQSLYAGRDGEPVQYGDLVVFTMPNHGDILLSGGSSVRTNTTSVNTDEVWQIFALPTS